MYLVLWCCKLLFCCDTEIGEVGMLVRTARGGDDFPLSISFEKYVHCPVLLSLDIHHITFFLIIWTLSQCWFVSPQSLALSVQSQDAQDMRTSRLQSLLLARRV